MRLFTVFFTIVVFHCLLSFESKAQADITIPFKVFVPKDTLYDFKKVELIGNVEPLSRKKPVVMTKINDSVFASEITFKDSERYVGYSYKFYSKINYEGGIKITPLNSGIVITDTFGHYRTIPLEQFRPIPKASIASDLAVLSRVLPDLHPAFDRYTNKQAFTAKVNEVINNLPDLVTDAQAYLAVSEIVATLKCGSTYTNFENQSLITEKLVFDRSDKLPFTLHITNRQIFIVKNLSPLKGIESGSEIKSINGVPSAEIIAKLLTLVKADGDNKGQRISGLQLTGLGRYEAFDIYFPLLFPPKNGNTYTLEIKHLKSKRIQIAEIVTVKRDYRKEKLLNGLEEYKSRPRNLELKIIEKNKTALLTINYFSDYEEWPKRWLAAFGKVNDKKIKNLIIDLRGNEGGSDEVARYFLDRITTESFQGEKSVNLVRYQKFVPEYKNFMNLKFSTSNWRYGRGRDIDSSFFDFSNVTEPYKNGYYKFLDSNKIFTGSFVGGKHGYQVKINLIFLVDGSNSALTYNLIRTIKHNKLGTIIGTETGGDGRGVNTGSIVKLRLPNTKIGVDIPLIGTYYNEGKPGGVQPDIKVQVPALPFLYKKDFYLNAALEYINKK